MPAAPLAPPPTRHVTSGGSRVYTLALDAFPHLGVNAFLVVAGDPAAPSYTALIDTGSSQPGSTDGLWRGLAAVRDGWGEAWTWEGLSRVVVSHAHPDHAAGLPFVRRWTRAPVAAHRLSVPVLQDPEGARDATVREVEGVLAWAGVGGEYAARMHSRARNLMLPTGVAVDTVLEDGEELDGVFRVVHTPGHAGGQVCLVLDDVLLSADHLLPRNSPPLMPERAHPWGGLSHYLASLDRLEALEGVTVALGGHGDPMPDWRGRVRALRERYAGKVQAVLEAAGEPVTVQELTLRLFPRLSRVQALLLLDQTGALVEYLVRQGRLEERTGDAVPGEHPGTVFRRVPGSGAGSTGRPHPASEEPRNAESPTGP